MPRNNGRERRERRQAEAVTRAEVTGQLHPTQRLDLVQGRPGDSRKETARLRAPVREEGRSKRRRARERDAQMDEGVIG